MQELYLGLVPGEASIDRLVDGAVIDPALTPAPDAAADRIIGDPLTGAILGIVPLAHRSVDPGDGGLWRRLRTRWIGAHDAAGASHV
jgi:hypothetical protein